MLEILKMLKKRNSKKKTLKCKFELLPNPSLVANLVEWSDMLCMPSSNGQSLLFAMETRAGLRRFEREIPDAVFAHYFRNHLFGTKEIRRN